MKDVHPAVPQSLRVAYTALHSQYPDEPIFAVRCCGRIYLGPKPASKCRTCEEVPKNIEITSAGDLDSL
jgi:hypothetical protein